MTADQIPDAIIGNLAQSDEHPHKRADSYEPDPSHLNVLPLDSKALRLLCQASVAAMIKERGGPELGTRANEIRHFIEPPEIFGHTAELVFGVKFA